ncbi:hypothetical protein [Sphingobacterium sp. LRF_L2]|uniref:hypothetical protein n=1 Tax=Sphingobacterium sp. LRF_L2 TaxID=3369421 RepID=UPI003F5F1808
MEEFKIFCLDDSEYMDFESFYKGYRIDVYVLLSNKYYQLSVYNPTRLIQDFDSDIEYQGYYNPDVNLVLVEDITPTTINFIVGKLHYRSYFTHIKPIELTEEEITELKPFIVRETDF